MTVRDSLWLFGWRVGALAALVAGAGFLVGAIQSLASLSRPFAQPFARSNAPAYALLGIAGIALSIWALRRSKPLGWTLFDHDA